MRYDDTYFDSGKIKFNIISISICGQRGMGDRDVRLEETYLTTKDNIVN